MQTFDYGGLMVCILLESMASWRERVKEDYEEWKTEVWDPADEAERKDLRASLRPCIDGDLLGQSASRRVRAASKQFSGLVSFSMPLCHIHTYLQIGSSI
jgi:hypothetical protein